MRDITVVNVHINGKYSHKLSFDVDISTLDDVAKHLIDWQEITKVYWHGKAGSRSTVDVYYTKLD